MTMLSEIKYRFERLLSEIYVVRSHENNQQVCIDFLEPRSRLIIFICPYVHLLMLIPFLRIYRLSSKHDKDILLVS